MYTTPDQSRYRYRLDGYDDDWVDAETVRRASYTGLHPGSYTFRLESANGTSDWGQPAEWSFVIPPLLWQALWFRLLVATAVIGLMAMAYRYRVRKLIEVERLRMRIASDLHDDIGANLSSIALLSRMLEGRASLGDREQRQLSRIGEAARETMSGLRDVIWLVDPRHDNLAALLHRMRTTATGLLDGTQWELDAPDPLPDLPLGTSLIRNTFLVHKEALNNAVRHGRPQHVHIAVTIDNHRLQLLIEDNGIGFLTTNPGHGNGLANMRRRAEEVGGHVHVMSAPGKGTRVRFVASLRS